MAAPAAGEIDKAELKKLLVKSKKEPVNCAVGTGKDAQALIMLHKIKQPRALAKELEKEFGEVKNPRWGTAFVDIDDNPKLVILTLNKPSPGVARKLKKTLKGTGFTKVRIVLEDGTVDDADEGDEEEEEGEAKIATGPRVGSDDTQPQAPAAPAEPAPAAAAQTDQPAPAAATEAPASEAAPAFDVVGLTKRLTDLVRRMIAAIVADPSQQDVLKALAVQAQGALKNADPATQGVIDQLEAALSGGAAAAPARAASASAAPPAPGAAAAGGQMVAFAKARVVWVAARKKVQGEIDKLHAEMTTIYKDHGFGADLDKILRGKVEPVLDSLDESLAHKLDEVTGNADPAQHAKLVGEAKQIIQSYESYISTEPLIAKLDDNPFVPLQIEKTLTATLSALTRVIA